MQNALKRSPKSRKVQWKRDTLDTTPEEGELAAGFKKTMISGRTLKSDGLLGKHATQ
jgi:hypothetical protein